MFLSISVCPNTNTQNTADLNKAMSYIKLFYYCSKFLKCWGIIAKVWKFYLIISYFITEMVENILKELCTSFT